MEPFIALTREEKLEYMQLKTDIAQLTKRADELGERFLAEMVSTGTEVIESELGKISIANKKKWTMPEELVALKAYLKSREELAQKIGTATFEEAPYMLFKSKKEE